MSEVVADPALSKVAEAIAAQYGHDPVPPSSAEFDAAVETAVTLAEAGGEPFGFDPPFQRKIAALALRDPDFMAAAGHLLKPDYFEHAGDAALVDLSLKYWDKYGRLPDEVTVVQLVKDSKEKKIIRAEHMPAVVEAIKACRTTSIADREYVIEKVAEFARHQAVSAAILKAVDWLERKDFGKVEKVIKEAIEVGANVDGGDYDYFAAIEQRTEVRLEKAAGKLPPTGITTGIAKLNERLYHRGWGRKELTVLLGGAKAGKTMALVNFAKFASLAGFNVLYVTLEVSRDIIAERLDACMTGTEMVALGKNIHDIRDKVASLMAKAGKLKIHEFPPGCFTPKDLNALIQRYKSKGVVFDLVVVDYADIMAPDYRTQDPIENSKNIYTGLRAIAVVENVAMLTATQTNRTGYTATVAKAEHVAEDFNKVRIADLMISINATDEERAKNEARLYFTASRNQEGNFTIVIRQNRAKMVFIEQVLGIE